MLPRDRLRAALARDVKVGAKPALVAFLTAGYPEPRDFLKTLRAVSVTRPFSSPFSSRS